MWSPLVWRWSSLPIFRCPSRTPCHLPHESPKIISVEGFQHFSSDFIATCSLQCFDRQEVFHRGEGFCFRNMLLCVWWCESDWIHGIFEIFFLVIGKGCRPHCCVRHRFGLWCNKLYLIFFRGDATRFFGTLCRFVLNSFKMAFRIFYHLECSILRPSLLRMYKTCGFVLQPRLAGFFALIPSFNF